MAGAAIFALFGYNTDFGNNIAVFIRTVLYVSIAVNLITLFFEITTPHPTSDSKMVVDMITKGRYKNNFWFGAILLGNIIPVILMFSGFNGALTIAGTLVLAGIFITEKIWVEAPQRIQLS